ncbi:two-component system, NarL family, nitrate/nitrite response regulator NarL [Novimethylophilus kurashikiensis]|uniref:Two-component system, NarL family, nitrate/nitrite response regulator NarL n=1 Tax=Novimethylophilus kurashikiensis TaxID=1825523 RepID=A0A2R5FA76_9PROT|nr:response regulator transcription factor [Novimethylophilus kurashikiensis]GBG14935.1 two-component system, NarL family, nitrate/nitrite response regulator NarL [Novimethylophilus kurashikiensis]
MTAIRILLVDDHALFRSGIHALLERQEEFQIVGEAADGLEGYKLAKQLEPDILLLDLHMPSISGVDTLKMVREEMPELCIIMLTVSEDADDLMAAIRAGANGYLLKNIDMYAFIECLHRAYKGDAVVSPQLAGKLMSGLQGQNTATESEVTSPRERQVLALLAKGASNKDIARRLEVAESTVKIHIQHILRKLNLSSRVQAAVYASEHGYAKLYEEKVSE